MALRQAISPRLRTPPTTCSLPLPLLSSPQFARPTLASSSAAVADVLPPPPSPMSCLRRRRRCLASAAGGAASVADPLPAADILPPDTVIRWLSCLTSLHDPSVIERCHLAAVCGKFNPALSFFVYLDAKALFSPIRIIVFNLFFTFCFICR
jgi:hypothetical protein